MLKKLWKVWDLWQLRNLRKLIEMRKPVGVRAPEIFGSSGSVGSFRRFGILGR